MLIAIANFNNEILQIASMTAGCSHVLSREASEVVTVCL